MPPFTRKPLQRDGRLPVRNAKPIGESAVPGPLKWHGGKFYLAKKIVALMPPHLHYVEPYAGGLAVLLAKDSEGVSEVANDLNRGLTNFWQVLQNAETFQTFVRQMGAMPFSEFEFERARLSLGVCRAFDVGAACNLFVCCRMSLAGRMKNFTGVTRTRTRRGMNNEVSAWLTAVEGLPAVHARLRRVLILNRPALDVIRGQDGKDTMFYLDPPYMHETRATTGEYAHEMTAEDHRQLLETLAGVRGKFLLSGYPSPLYDDYAAKYGWHRLTFDLPNHAAGGAAKRRMTECLWLNYVPPASSIEGPGTNHG